MLNREPQRTCIVCRKKGTKENFIKIVYNKNGSADIEKEKKLEGRGAYICKSEQCLLKCIKTKALNRAFKTNINSCVYEELLNELSTN